MSQEQGQAVGTVSQCYMWQLVGGFLLLWTSKLDNVKNPKIELIKPYFESLCLVVTLAYFDFLKTLIHLVNLIDTKS